MHIKKYGTFENTVFDNGRIKYEIHGLNAEIHTHSGSILVKDVHPEIWINDNGWEKIKYKEIGFFNYTSNGTHRVVVEAEHEGKIYSYMVIVYEEKTEFSPYRPLFPKLFISFNKTMQYKVKMVLENIKINHFLIIDNGTGYTEPPFKKGHMKHEIYNGTIKRNKDFRAWHDIVIGYSEGKKKFGLNWEKYKGVYRNLKFEKGDSGINMEVESDPQEMSAYTVKTVGFPIPDTGGGGGGGGSGGGGGTPPTDIDKDGLSDNTEIAGWYVYWYDGTGHYHNKHVTSDPNKKDTDGDGANDKEEYQQQTDPRNSDTDGDGMSDGYEIHYGKPAGGWQEPNWYNDKYAVIIVGGGYRSSGDDAFYPAFWNDGKEMYYKLIDDYNYLSNNVYLISSQWYVEGGVGWRGYGPSNAQSVGYIIRGEAMWDSPTHYDIKDALDDISRMITVHDSLLIVIIAHGGNLGETGGFFHIRADISDSDAEENPASQMYPVNCDYSYPVNFGAYLNEHFGGNNGIPRKYAVMSIIIQSCDSGSFIPNLEGDYRIVITAAKWNEEAYTEANFWSRNDHWAFLYQGAEVSYIGTATDYPGVILSLGSIKSPNSLYNAFSKGLLAAEKNKLFNKYYSSTPQIYNSNLAQVIYL